MRDETSVSPAARRRQFRRPTNDTVSIPQGAALTPKLELELALVRTLL
jgi:hypothetical protein